MLRAIGWTCVFALLTGFGAANIVGYCVPELKKYSHEEALLFALHDAASSRTYIIPEIKTVKDAQTYMNKNPDCCHWSYQNDPIRVVTGLYKGAYSISLPRVGGPANLHSEFTYVLTNCLRVRKIWEIGHIKE